MDLTNVEKTHDLLGNWECINERQCGFR